MAGKILSRKFFFEPEVLSVSTKLAFNKSPITCFNTVADMKRYPEFVPWMRKVSVTTTSPTTSDSIITIGYPPFTQPYLSKVTLTFPSKIVSLSNNNEVFEIMESIWEFYPEPNDLTTSAPQVHLSRCKSIYSVKFKFASIVYQQFSSMVLNTILSETSKAFVAKIATLPNIDCVYDKTRQVYIQPVK